MTQRKLIIIPFNLPWNWSTDYTNQTAFELAKTHCVICYMWADSLTIKEYLRKKQMPFVFKRYSKNLYIFNPILFIPFRRFNYIVRLNEQLNIWILGFIVFILNIKNKFYRKILWYFDPQTAYLSKYFGSDWLKLYDCVDYFSGAYKVKKEKDEFLKKERALVLESDYVFANSLVLKDHLSKIRSDIYLVAQGFRVNEFSKNSSLIPVVLKKDDRPLIGFVGAINGRLNYKLLFDVAKKSPDWDFVLWGPVLEENTFTGEQKELLNKLTNLPNVLRGKSEKKEIPGIVKQFDIGMIPYDERNMFNKYCYPMKIFEFFYTGIPVISTEISELHRFPDLVEFGSTAVEWINKINKILVVKWPNSKKIKSKKLASENSWENKVKSILKVIG
jgi:hypothetical protein